MQDLNNYILLENMTDSLGRKYMISEIESNVERLNGLTVLGELGSGNSLSINLDRVSHRITNFRIENNNLIADIQVFSTPLGLIVKSLLENDCKIQTSIRATGYVDSDKVTGVNIITFDIGGDNAQRL